MGYGGSSSPKPLAKGVAPPMGYGGKSLPMGSQSMSATECLPCEPMGGGKRPAAEAPPTHRKIHLKLNGWWETPETLQVWRIWAKAGLCGFPGCGLGEKHSGDHSFDPELIQFAR